jgi:hypothetical protein
VAAGEEIRTGEPGYGYEADGRTSVKNYMLDNETCLEIEGMEIIGPNNGTYREKLKAVRLIIDGQERNQITMNEQMAPFYNAGTRNVIPDFRDYYQNDGYTPVVGNYACTNFGKGMLAGGSSANATPKVGPGQDLLVKVQIPRTTEGGADISSGIMRVRLHTIQVRTNEKLIEVLKHYGHMPDGSGVDASFTLGDLENTEDMPTKMFEKRVPLSGDFGLADWSSLHGGNEVDLPYVERYITYAQNAAASTPNSWYDFTMEGQRITSDFQELDWNLTARDAIRVEHIGVMTNNNSETMRMWIDGRPKHPEYRIDPVTNTLPMPQGRFTNAQHFQGPARMSKSYMIWNQHGSIQVKDNGTAIPAWTTPPTTGVMVGIWGHKYHMRGTE